MILTLENFDAVYNSFTQNKVSYEALWQNSVVNVELTLNHPPTAKWNKLSRIQQIDRYTDIFNKILDKFRDCVGRNVLRFEECKSGKLHCHGLIEMTIPHAFFRKGLVCDIVKVWLGELNYSHKKFLDDHYYNDFERYVASSVCCQLSDAKKRAELWEEYINKDFLSQ